jgi:hypothetical protein
MFSKATVLNPAKIFEAINRDSFYAFQLSNRFLFRPKDLPMMLMFGHAVLKNIVKVSVATRTTTPIQFTIIMVRIGELIRK